MLGDIRDLGCVVLVSDQLCPSRLGWSIHAFSQRLCLTSDSRHNASRQLATPQEGACFLTR
ncbi:hypothetical protein E2C01_039068 [Portunus trituberculatus]|uniref:Uncharacterized protein n=1 Tax=Portunus trituberculatus TaxID=210409 RepID=A0A5B7FCM2_PORTR|nr:hypothetical protein [Portunus trituberculatus]